MREGPVLAPFKPPANTVACIRCLSSVPPGAGTDVFVRTQYQGVTWCHPCWMELQDMLLRLPVKEET